MSFSDVTGSILKIGAVLMFLSMTGFSQRQERSIDKMSWRTEPIRIVKLTTKDKTIELRKQFIEDDDWLKGLTVTVQNVSEKAIARIDLHLSFPRPGGGTEQKPNYGVSMAYGLDPTDPGAETMKLVQPGESVDVRLPEANLPFINSDLKSLGYPEKITHAQIRVEYVTFVDGSVWAGDGVLLYPDRNNPKRKVNPMVPNRTGPDIIKPPQGSVLFLAAPDLWQFQNPRFIPISGRSILHLPGFHSRDRCLKTLLPVTQLL